MLRLTRRGGLQSEVCNLNVSLLLRTRSSRDAGHSSTIVSVDPCNHVQQDKEVAVVVSFLEIYCDRVRDLGEAYMSHRGRQVEDLKTTSDVYREMKSVRRDKSQLPIMLL